MRLWTLHPKYLDAVGLVALWRGALLAMAVLRGRTTTLRGVIRPRAHSLFRVRRGPIAEWEKEATR
jgi:hypothetical protein